MTALYEQYRPKQWSEVVGQSKAIRQIDTLRARGLAGRAYWVSGKSGQGKTTIARLLAAEIADDWATHELDAGTVTPAELERLERDLQSFGGFDGSGRTGKAVIINEAHGLRAAAIRQLLVMLERIPSHVVWIFTTTKAGQESLFEDMADAHPLLSRCVVIALAERGLAKPFAELLQRVAQAHELDGRPIEDYVRVVNDNGGNLRACFNFVEAGGMLKTTNSEV